MENREIKFRAWLPNENKMTHSHILEEIVSICSLGYPQYAIWLQYTGRPDIDGNDIYEGDIITHGESIRQVMQIDCRWIAKRVESNESILLCFATKPKILGNIYQNPDLL
jgi:hypothetical protein